MTIVNATSKVVTLILTEETKVIFPYTFSSIAIRSENNVGISEYSGKQLGDSGVLRCNEGESILYPTLVPKNFIYLIGTGKVEIFVGNNLVVNPFKNGGKGGETLLNYLGITTTALSDGSSANPIIVDGVNIIAQKSDWAIYDSKDFIYNGLIWQQVGDFENYYTKAQTDTLLALKANAADVYTKAQSDDRYVQISDVTNVATSQEIADSINNIWGV